MVDRYTKRRNEVTTPPNYFAFGLLVLIGLFILLIFRIRAVVKYYNLAFMNPVDVSKSPIVIRFVINLILTIVILAMSGYVGLLICMAATIKC